jgi:asparagine synthase (glutamine-hydrolysing)
MCGLFFSTLDSRTNHQFFDNISNLIKHRGIYPPDFHQDGNRVFAHALLPVQGSSPIRQPLIDGTRVLIFAGELWQHAGQTSDTQYLFRTLCQSDDIAKTLRILRGMFAIVFKDKDTIYFASDVFGEVPLYFWRANHKLCVASEIKQLIAAGAPLKQIRPALPGVVYLFRNNELSSVSYHTWSFVNDASEFDAKLLRKLIRRSVREHYTTIDLQQSAVLLSGGLDSSIIAYELAQLGLKEAYTIGIDPQCPDFAMARYTAEQLRLRHHVVIASELNTDTSIAVTEVSNRSIVEAACCHIALSNLLNANNVRVVFTGSGADEIFVGYQHLLRFVAKKDRNKLQRYFVEKYHAFDLRALNKMYMLNAIEVRNPFLSVDLMNYAATLNVDKLLIGPKRQMKLALRRAYEPLIGEVANNPKLIAFETMGLKKHFRIHNGNSPFAYRKRFKEIFSNPKEFLNLINKAKELR